MGNSFFRFKQFRVRQERATMKVGTDGVLLGAWANTTGAQRILDVGSGTALIAIMLAQRCLAHIHAVEMDEASHLQAMDNIKRSPWGNRIDAFHATFQQFSRESRSTYDLIVSNPPYFINSLKPTETGRMNARHTELLPHEELLEGILAILNPSGRFCAIFPYVEGNIFVALAAAKSLYCTKRLNITSKPGGNVKRILVEFGFVRQPLEEAYLSIYNLRGDYSSDYKLLTKDFYLAF